MFFDNFFKLKVWGRIPESLFTRGVLWRSIASRVLFATLDSIFELASALDNSHQEMEQLSSCDIAKEKKHFTSPQKTLKAKKNLSTYTCLLGAFYGPTRMLNLRSSCLKIQIFLGYVERCSTSGT